MVAESTKLCGRIYESLRYDVIVWKQRKIDFFLDKFVGRVNDKRQANVFIVFYRRKNRKIEVEFF